MAGGKGESVTQPLWAGGRLYFISDRTDFWNIYTEEAPGEVNASGGLSSPCIVPDPVETGNSPGRGTPDFDFSSNYQYEAVP